MDSAAEAKSRFYSVTAEAHHLVAGIDATRNTNATPTYKARLIVAALANSEYALHPLVRNHIFPDQERNQG